MTESLFESNSGRRVTISSYSPSFIDLWLAPRLTAFYAAIPDIDIIISVDYQLTPFLPAHSDIMIAYEDPAVSSDTFVPLVDERLVAIAAPGLIGTTDDAWLNTPLIRTLGPRMNWTAWFDEVGQEKPSSIREIQVNSMQSALALASAGIGIALDARPLIDDALLRGDVEIVPPHVECPTLSHGLVLDTTVSRPAIVEEVIHWLIEDARKGSKT